MGFVLLALICVQLFWISNVIRLTERRFEQDVNSALNDVVVRFEKVSMSKLTRKFNFRKQAVRWLAPKIDSLRGKMVGDTNREHPMYTIQNKKQYNVKVFEELTSDSNGIITSKLKHTYYTHDSALGGFAAGVKFESGDSEDTSSSIDRKLQALLQHRSDVMNELFDEFVSVNVYNDVSSRIDTMQVDSLLRTALGDQDISVPYCFGILNSTKDTVLMASKGSNNADLLASSYLVNLSPRNIFVRPRFLAVYFPSEANHILYKLRLILLTSLILIIIIIGAFYYTISTIFRQKKLSEVKSDLINNMTHEFKTPISTISLASEVLNDKTIVKSEEATEKYLDIIRNENKRLAGMVETILQAAILDKGELKLKIQEVDVHEVISDVVQSMRLQIQNKNGEVTMNLEAQRYSLFADRMHLGNIIYNLIDNAIKYCKLEPRIVVSTQNTNDELIISVQDNGIGIIKEDQKKIFETFYRVHTGNVHNVKGFGLGLSYVKAVAEKHGGHALVNSEIGKGSTFIVYLPFNSSVK